MKIQVEIDGQIYDVDVENIHNRPVVAIIDGERYEVWPAMDAQASEPSQMTKKPAISVPEPASKPVSAGTTTLSGGDLKLTAPLPGVIVAILVKPGDKVSRGQELCTLEAMKMKNAIRAARDAVIETIEVNVGDQVNHGQVLMTFAG